MPASQPNSLIQRGGNPTTIEGGRIINVDIAHWTVDVRTSHSQRQLLDCQVGAPYLHFAAGEGIYAMPEVGAKVQMCLPADGAPFVLCFCTTFEREGTVDGGDTPAPTMAEEPEEQETPSEVTYRAGRPRLQQGDIMLRCRDGNQVWLHRGGVVEIAASGLARRYYIPLANTIRDVCENWDMISLAGEMGWSVTRSDTTAGGEAEALWSCHVREHAQDQLATVLLRMGYVDETKRVRLMVAPTKINADGEVDDGSDPVYLFEVDEEGSVTITSEKDYTREITGDYTDRIDGDTSYTHTGDVTRSVGGDLSDSISGSHEMTASDSRETLSGSKVISSPQVHLGGSGGTPVVLATPAVLTFFLSHKHPVMGSVTGTPDVPVTPDAAQARKVFGE